MSRSTLALGGVLIALAAVLLRMVAGPVGVGSGLLGWYLPAWALFSAALWLSRRVPERRLGALVVAGGIALSATGLAAPPSTSTDSFRYAWDGRVQAAGISPYDHPPSAPALAELRDDWLFPGDCTSPALYPLPDGGCTRINRPTEPTIYPPVAQAYFLLIHWLSPEGTRHKALQLGGWAMAVLALVALWRLAGARRAAYWAWCPAVPAEAINNAHVDMLAVLLVVLAFHTTRTAAHRTGAVLPGALLGAAVAAKLLPVTTLPGALSGVLSGALPGTAHDGPASSAPATSTPVGAAPTSLAPAANTPTGGAPAANTPAGSAPASRARAHGVAWRRIAVTLVPAALVVALSYLPYLLASGSSVAGYLPGYLKEERYDGGGHRYAVLRLVVPDSWAPYAAIALLGLIVLYVLRYGDPDRPWRGALLVSGSLLLLFTPGYSWYALLVVALVAMDGRWEWLGAALAGAVAYVAGPSTPDSPGPPLYVAATLAVLIGWAARQYRHRRRRRRHYEHRLHRRSAARLPAASREDRAH
ncbi:glycosyltransferase 87 family protein [[Actinomadura] parvosata]|uniref:glycosyltransferase 87 family protein n=1 Tax=[Actinomadura] parvosata TaxID=1955412 RepID=UPI00406D02C8